MERLYLDNAATSWPKPESVYRAVDHYQRNVGVAVGRSPSPSALQAAQLVDQARRRVAELIGAKDPNRVVFTQNGTDSLNLAIHGLLQKGDHVVTTVAEHNSVLRPLRFLEEHRQIEVTRVSTDESGVVQAEELAAAVGSRTRLVAMIHASNVTGAVQPIEAAADIAHTAGARLLVDAAQSVGHLPIDVAALPIDLLAAPCHKGLLGPLGAGILYVGPGVEEVLLPSRQGGTGTQSEQDRQPENLPDKYESGSANLPALAGLAAATEWILQQSVASLNEHQCRLTGLLLQGLGPIEGLRLVGPADPERQVGVVSFQLKGYDPQELALLLESAFGVEARAGFHCAPLMHRALGTDEQGGTLRLSVGAMSTDDQIDRAVDAVRQIATST